MVTTDLEAVLTARYEVPIGLNTDSFIRALSTPVRSTGTGHVRTHYTLVKCSWDGRKDTFMTNIP